MRIILRISTILALLVSGTSFSQNLPVGLRTEGTVSEINLSSGELTEKGAEEISSFSLGGIARKLNTLYYIAAPSGSNENSIYTLNITTSLLTKIDLDRTEGDDEVRALFLKGSNLYGVFYNSSTNASGVYRIDPATGITTLILDLTTLDIEPIGGAYTRFDKFFYILGKPLHGTDGRKLIRFKLKTGSAQAVDIVDSAGSPVLCDRLKFNLAKLNFICAATVSESQVDICKLNTKGKASCLSTLPDTERIAGGHTLLSPNSKDYYLFVYAPGDSNQQRLIKFNAKGVVKQVLTIPTLFVGAQFKIDGVASIPVTK